MAVKDKARLRARLNGLYPATTGFLQQRLDALAAKLKATDDSTDEDIDAELTALNDSGFQTFEEIKVADDRHRNEVNRLKKPETPKPVETEPEPTTTDPVILQMQKQMKALQDKLDEKDAAESKRTIADRFSADPRLKGVPASWVKNNLPSTEDEFETKMEGLVKEYGEFAAEHKLAAFGNDAPPAAKPGEKGAKPQATKEEADALAASLLPNIR